MKLEILCLSIYKSLHQNFINLKIPILSQIYIRSFFYSILEDKTEQKLKTKSKLAKSTILPRVYYLNLFFDSIIIVMDSFYGTSKHSFYALHSLLL